MERAFIVNDGTVAPLLIMKRGVIINNGIWVQHMKPMFHY
jgi:hypothetical protein